MKKTCLILSIVLVSFGLSAQTSAEAYYGIANLVEEGNKKLSAKDYYGAVSDFSKAAELIPYLNDPNSIADKIYTNRALAKRAIGDYKNAIVDLDKALEFYGSDTNIKNYLLRGEAKLVLQDYSSALSDFSKIIKINSKPSESNTTIIANAYTYRGMSKEGLGDNSACEDYKKGAELGGDFNKNLYELGNCN